MESILNKRNLQELKTKLKKKYPLLTEAELSHRLGIGIYMLRMMEDKLRKTNQEMREIIIGL